MSTLSQAPDVPAHTHAVETPALARPQSALPLSDPLRLLPARGAGATGARPRAVNQPSRMAQILNLQQTLGNRHTRRLLQRATAAPATPRPSAHPAPRPLELRESDPAGSAAGPPVRVIQRQLKLSTDWDSSLPAWLSSAESVKQQIQADFQALETLAGTLQAVGATATPDGVGLLRFIAKWKAKTAIAYADKDRLTTGIAQHKSAVETMLAARPAPPDPQVAEADASTEGPQDPGMSTEEKLNRLVAQLKDKTLTRADSALLQQIEQGMTGRRVRPQQIEEWFTMAKAINKRAKTTPAKTIPAKTPAKQPAVPASPAAAPPTATLAGPAFADLKQQLLTAWKEPAFQAKLVEAKQIEGGGKKATITLEANLLGEAIAAAQGRTDLQAAEARRQAIVAKVNAITATKATQIEKAVTALRQQYSQWTNLEPGLIRKAAEKQGVPGCVDDIAAAFKTHFMENGTVEGNHLALQHAEATKTHGTMVAKLITNRAIAIPPAAIVRVYVTSSDKPSPYASKDSAPPFSIKMPVAGLPSGYELHAHIEPWRHWVAKGANPVHIKQGDISYPIKEAQWDTVLPSSAEISEARANRALWDDKLRAYEQEHGVPGPGSNSSEDSF